jgi:hypothetical protein
MLILFTTALTFYLPGYYQQLSTQVGRHAYKVTSQQGEERTQEG